MDAEEIPMTTTSRKPPAANDSDSQFRVAAAAPGADRYAVYSPRLGLRPSGVPPLQEYVAVIGEERMERVLQAARALRDRRIVELNATATGGGVAEMLFSSVPFMNLLGVETEWRVIPGNESFFECTKGLHNLLQGKRGEFTREMERTYCTTMADIVRHDMVRSEDDIVIVNDPQPLGLARHLKKDGQSWLWRCHIDIENGRSNGQTDLWNFMESWIHAYDAAIFSAMYYVVTGWRVPSYVIPPFIDPLSEKNRSLTGKEIETVTDRYGIDTGVPIIAQIGRFDPWKGIDRTIETFRQVRKEVACQLIIAGGIAGDDPEGNRILEDIREKTKPDKDVHLLKLSLDDRMQNWLEVNALQRAADIVMQPSTREGFGLVITEALWKGKPVIGSDVGGIPLQIHDGENGLYFDTPQKTAKRIVHLLKNPASAAAMGRKAHEAVKERFLLPDRVGDYLAAIGMTLDCRRSTRTNGSITSFYPWYRICKGSK